MSDDLSLERALIEELIGIPVCDTTSLRSVKVWYFTRTQGRLHITIGTVSTPSLSVATLRSGVYCEPYHGAHHGNGWLFVNSSLGTATWPPCSFAEFIEKLRDPKIREACGLKPLEEI